MRVFASDEVGHALSKRGRGGNGISPVGGHRLHSSGRQLIVSCSATTPVISGRFGQMGLPGGAMVAVARRLLTGERAMSRTCEQARVEDGADPVRRHSDLAHPERVSGS